MPLLTIGCDGLSRGLCTHGFHGNAIYHSPAVKKSFVEAIKAGLDCVIADIERCRPSLRNALMETLRTELAPLDLEYHCLWSQPDRCIRDVIARRRHSGDKEQGKIEGPSGHYVLLVGGIEYDVMGRNTRS